jgi:hypothetical protein
MATNGAVLERPLTKEFAATPPKSIDAARRVLLAIDFAI